MYFGVFMASRSLLETPDHRILQLSLNVVSIENDCVFVSDSL